MSAMTRQYADHVEHHRACPIETNAWWCLADHECDHGRLPGDRTTPCGCWAQERVATPTNQKETIVV